TGFPAGLDARPDQYLSRYFHHDRARRPLAVSARLCAKLRADNSRPTRSIRSSATHSSTVSPWRSASSRGAARNRARNGASVYSRARNVSNSGLITHLCTVRTLGAVALRATLGQRCTRAIELPEQMTHRRKTSVALEEDRQRTSDPCTHFY